MEPLDLREKNSSEEEVILSETQKIPGEPSGFDKFKESFWEVFKIVFISLIIIVPIRLYVVQPFIVEGDSMVPNFHDGEYLIVDEISYRFNQPHRGDVIIFHPPQSPKNYYIKRIIGLPEETIEFKDGSIYVYNKQWPQGQLLDESGYLTQSQIREDDSITLKENEYYVIGDNRDNSLDSRRFGPIRDINIKGRAFIRAYPFSSFTTFKAQGYNLSS
ncbi:MAG: signal peptidase I [Candidatus Komeilibacteria bacterium CG10_big_fil_rev_8_21_14_0_10_41_13]|uniref:Signal peptidase I n=1 Tax=Candidatus Komeilibacteria bacterium CG10_big_fil_rev_8_21_14_0_10_41_13 TaxID=1974476 RepID=A0A2M6WBZ7_9BACT|nr:MAG: signal peptidase I [Candidatus Komeilibacteria bacterium CG10_big_fil_rev_8_21_14_0_10_41_13]